MKRALNIVFKEGTKQRELVRALLRRPIPQELRLNQRQIRDDDAARLRDALIQHFFTNRSYYPDPPEIYLSTEVGKNDLHDHMFRRLHSFRSSVIPWLHSAMMLKGARILEIGSGTGASTIALAEQGAKVFGIDVSEGALEVAGQRCQMYGLDVEFAAANGAEFSAVTGSRQFDAVIYFAVLEHMTWQERQASLASAWDHLRPGNHLVIIETPNRLWYFDDHTSGEPFFYWLADETAIEYSRFTKRQNYNRVFSGDITEEQRTLLARWGRGVSFHDFVLAFGISPERLPITSDLTAYNRQGVRRFRPESSHTKLLKTICPTVHASLFRPYLDLVFQKA